MLLFIKKIKGCCFIVQCPVVIIEKYLRLSKPITNSANQWESELVPGYCIARILLTSAYLQKS